MWGATIKIGPEDWLPKKDLTLEEIRPSQADMIQLVLFLAEHAPTLEDQTRLAQQAASMMAREYGVK